jgi:RNA polymerase sigma-70 factor (ECF subfamily)
MSDAIFQQLVDAHYEALYRFALSLARRDADACDLVQQTFYLWATHGHSLRDPAAAKAWLFTTLYREFLRQNRRSARQSSIEELPAGADSLEAPAVDVVRGLDGAQVMQCLQEVDENYRAPLTLFYLEQLSYLEIAAVLEIPIGTVMSRLSRGKTQLRTLLERARQSPRVVPFPGARSAQNS